MTIDTIITINPETSLQHIITLPYQTHLRIKDLIDNEVTDTFRVAFGSTDTKIDISKELQDLSNQKTRYKGEFNKILITSGDITLEMKKVMVEENVYPFGRYFDLDCTPHNVRRIDYVV